MDFNVTNIPVHTNVVHYPTQETMYERKHQTSARIPPLEYDAQVFYSLCADYKVSFYLTNPSQKAAKTAKPYLPPHPRETKELYVETVAEDKETFSITSKYRAHYKEMMRTALPYYPPVDNFSSLYYPDAVLRPEIVNVQLYTQRKPVAEEVSTSETGKIQLPQNENIATALASRLCYEDEVRRLRLCRTQEENPTIVLTGSVKQVVALEENGEWLAK